MSVVSKSLQIMSWYQFPDEFFRDIFKFDPYEYQSKFMKIWRHYKEHKRVLILSASGTGKTQLLAGTALYFTCVLSVVEKDPKDVIILSGSLAQARNVYKYIRDAIVNNDILKGMYAEFRQSDTVFRDGSSIKALSSSLTSIQGQHGDLVIVDEAALVDDFQLNDCYRIIGAHDGIIIWSGTPTQYDSLFVKTFEEEEAKMKRGEKTIWEIWTWSASECPKLQSQLAEAKSRLPEEMFKIFWEGRPFPLTGVLIPRDAMVNATRGIKKFNYNPEWKTVMGIDFGWSDPTAVVIFQTDGERYYCLECYKWSETDFDIINKIIKEKCNQYKVNVIYSDASYKGENQRLKAMGLPVFEIAFNKEKQIMQSRLRDLFVKGYVRIPDHQDFYDLIYELRTYTWTKKSGEDLVDATMLALKESNIVSSNDTGKIISMGRPRRNIRNPIFRGI